jgi:hypothetical protein
MQSQITETTIGIDTAVVADHRVGGARQRTRRLCGAADAGGHDDVDRAVGRVCAGVGRGRADRDDVAHLGDRLASVMLSGRSMGSTVGRSECRSRLRIPTLPVGRRCHWSHVRRVELYRPRVNVMFANRR